MTTATRTSAATRADARRGPTTAPGLRPEIQALRAAAVLAVVVNHLWPDSLAGGFLGVDVFFAISGFLITAHLLRELDRTGTIRLGRFWLRRTRRLLPASVLVLAVIAAAVLAWMPRAAWADQLGDVIASAVYAENWLLAASAVDYFASDAPAAAMHFWSLSVEEQFYLLWPLLLLAPFVLLRRRGAVIVVLASVTAASLVFSCWISSTQPDAAYFNTAARAWQFGAGGLLAVALSSRGVEAPARIRSTVSVLAWAALAVSFFTISGDLPLPGIVSGVPVAAAVAIIWAGTSADDRRPTRGARIGPAVLWLGGISYSLYLWHWPLIVLWPFAVGAELDLLGRIGILAGSIVLAGLTKHLVEDPVRTASFLTAGPRRRHLWLAAVSLAVVLAGAAGIMGAHGAGGAAERAAQSARSDCFASAAMAPGSDCERVHDLGSLDVAVAASTDMANTVSRGEVCIQDRNAADLVVCEFGASEQDAALTVALVGDSHAGHWIGALDVVAERESWRVVEYLKSSCPGILGSGMQADWYPEGASSCQAWTAAAVAEVAARDDIDAVITSSISRNYLTVDPSGTPRGPIPAADYRKTWSTWIGAGKQVVVLADTPAWNIGDVPTCVSGADTRDPCAVPVSARASDPMVAAAASVQNPALSVVDMNDFFCDDKLCHVAIGGVVAIGDGNHMTTTFSRSLAPFLGERLTAVLR